MSWAIQDICGKAGEIGLSVTTAFDAALKYYEGKPEGDDIVAAKTRVLAWLAAIPPESGVLVSASGSWGGGALPWLSVSVTCKSVKLG